MNPFNSQDLEAYLDESLPAVDMARVEQALRSDPQMLRQLAETNARRDAGVHSLGAIWRRHRLSCPTRDELGSYLLNALSGGAAQYVHFHVETIGCRYCQANVADLRNQQAEASEASESRRRKYFQSSAGYLNRR